MFVIRDLNHFVYINNPSTKHYGLPEEREYIYVPESDRGKWKLEKLPLLWRVNMI